MVWGGGGAGRQRELLRIQSIRLTGAAEQGEDTERANGGHEGEAEDLGTVVRSVKGFSGAFRAEGSEVGCRGK